MVYTPFILAASGLVTLSSAAPLLFSSLAPRAKLVSRDANSYTTFGGNGSPLQGWPAENEWVSSYDDMFSDNKDILSKSCTQWNVENNSDEEIKALKKSISTVAGETDLDPRFIFSIVMQESNGCVRAPTTDNGVINPGLMQSHNGKGSCNGANGVLNPCPDEIITQMIRDGAAGTADGDGLKQLVEMSGGSDVSKYYKAARMYNSGSIASSGNLGQGIATHCYASDIANRLLGWCADASKCDAGLVGTLTASEGSYGQVDSNYAQKESVDTTPESAPTSAPAVAETSSLTPTPTPTPTPISSPPASVTVDPPQSPATVTTTPSTGEDDHDATDIEQHQVTTIVDVSGGETTPSNKYPEAVDNCSLYHTITDGEYCDKVTEQFSISLTQLISWNKGLTADCKNLWLGYSYCVKST
ncbi:hypothetical protein EJ05DRAFT_511815 [Pseudovirgaria hyperparasitica]|uniref:LysM domain-containing protein n=1 Tax=Pseudovirgaria hyperparasitica TaxID=470096 RepID=A0A6A6W7L1_9PEZI|nr:uncharacterized protein EJ05DRAFT_511815 [Pseudovirgaria hyperparasitica]KAF2757071.1 hypothetical protein EJ05DRAFT_511815 [Pseudovirgaria hyperparasitica]